MDIQKDNRSEIHKSFQRIAADAVSPLREASDKGEIATPHLVLQVQAKVTKALEQVHYGFHEALSDGSSVPRD